MSQDDVEMIRSLYEPLNRGDWERFFRDVHPDVEFTAQRGPTAGTVRGHEAVQKRVQDLLAPFAARTFEPEKFFDGGDQVVVFVRLRSRPQGSSAEMEVRNGHLWTIREGAIRSMKTFPVREEALEAAGLQD